MSEMKVMAWLGFPKNQPKPTYDLIYDGTTRLEGYVYSPIYALPDHPSTERDNQSSPPSEDARHEG